MKKNNNDLFYLCSLIEWMGRRQKRSRKEIADCLGKEKIRKIYDYADVLHCEPIEKVGNEYIGMAGIASGVFDNEGQCRYRVPDYWTIGEVYERLIEDSYEKENMTDGIWEVYHSWISDSISDFNTDFYFQPREYIAACYRAGEVL